MIDFAAARVLYADHFAENPDISPRRAGPFSILASEFSFYFTWSTLRLPYLASRTAQI
jgi:hypothetical protein